MKHLLLSLVIGLVYLANPVDAQVNYNFSASTGAVSITSGAALTWTTTTANDEEYSAVTPIGFSFSYCGTVFTDFQASTNGFIRLGTGLSSATAADALDGSLRSIIAPLWDDLAVNLTATDITYSVTGAFGSQVLTVSWMSVKWNKTASAANAEFAVKLYETSNIIEFLYGTMGTPTAGSASIGLADNTVISTAGSAQGKFQSVNVGGTSGARTYHRTMSLPFNAINAAPMSGTTLTFTPVTPSPISGTFSVPTNFATLSDAAMALSINGISGPVTINISPGTYDDIFHLLNVGGTSSTNTVTVQATSTGVTLSPSNGSRTSTAPGITNTDAVIRVDGCEYITVNNLAIVDNANNSASTTLKFDIGICHGTSHLNGAVVAGARYNTVKNCFIDMKSTTGTLHTGSTGIRYGTYNSTETDVNKTNSFNTIQDVEITGFWRAAIRYFGTSGTNPDQGNTITALEKNDIGNVVITSGTGSDIRAIEVDVQKDITIEKTRIADISSGINTTNNIYGIWFNPGASGTNLNSGTIIVRNNEIFALDNSGTAITSGFAVGIACNNVAANTDIQVYGNNIYSLSTNGNTSSRATGIGLFVSTGTPATVKVYNNFVADLKAPRSTSGPGIRGLDLQNAAGGGVFSVYYNSVQIDDTTPPTAVNHQSACVYWANFGTGTLDLRNNIFVNKMSTNGSGRAVALYASANSNLVRLAATTDYNNYFISPVTAGPRGISTDVANTYADLSAHQAAVVTGGLGGPRDVNAKSVSVDFVSSTNLHLAGSSLGNMNFVGAPIVGYTTDIDGQTRDTQAPYIGADEATPALPVQLASFTATTSLNSVTLRWRTISETNNYGFEVQRRAGDSGEFQSLPDGFVAGNGTTSQPHDYMFVDSNVPAGSWQYRLKQIDLDGRFSYTDPVSASVVTSVGGEAVPASFLLAQNYPNPFNPETRIAFTLPEPSVVTLTVYSITGQEVAILVDEARSAGRHEVTWNGTSRLGNKVASGTYLYRIIAKGSNGKLFTDLKKMVILK